METTNHGDSYFHITWPATLPKCDGACQLAEYDSKRYDGMNRRERKRWVEFEKVKEDAELGCPKCMVIYHCCLEYEIPAHFGTLDVGCSYSGPGQIHLIWRYPGITKTTGQYTPLCHLQVHVQIDEPKPDWSIFRPWRLPTQARREEYICMLDAWRTECESTHEDCVTKDTKLPRRVLDVGSHTTPTLALHCSSHAIGQYVALSYCWGEKHPVKTQLSNLEYRQRGIDFESLPRTFKDAVKVTRDLGIQYLWIDSLCIVQDQPIDWERESSQMAAYYSNAYLVIAASMAANSTQGFLDAPTSQDFINPERSTEVGQIMNLDSTISRIYKSKQSRDHLSSHSLMFQDSPLSYRAWALQENILAKRIVHFTEYEVIWECIKDVKCECTQLDYTLRSTVTNTATNPTMRRHQLWYYTLGNASLHDAWLDVLALYSTMALSYDSDIFPALSGLAKVWQSRGSGKYLAGFWEEHILESMAWSAHGTGRLQRCQRYRAPSWSPFSLDEEEVYENRRTHAEFSFPPDDRRLARRDAVLTNSTAVPRGSDPTGQIESAILELHGRVIRFDDPPEYGILWEDWGSVKYDIEMDLDKGITLNLLLIGYDPGDRLIALIIKSSGEKDVYERVGYVHSWHEKDAELSQQFQATAKRAIMII